MHKQLLRVKALCAFTQHGFDCRLRRARYAALTIRLLIYSIPPPSFLGDDGFELLLIKQIILCVVFKLETVLIKIKVDEE